MLPAEPGSVLGDFADASYRSYGVESRFTHRGGRYRVRTEGPDGAAADYDIAFTFGVEPLQQYLVPFAGGRYQALGIAWDTRPAIEGGQRWFHLHPEERIAPDDVLHWTSRAGNWNTMCAECHSTNVNVGYVESGDRYETTWSDVNVACEACHGPGARHVAWAHEAGAGRPEDPGLTARLGDDVAWVFDAGAAVARPTRPRLKRTEIEVCAPCHARRSRIAAAPQPGEPFLDGYHPALLEAGLYYPDGQILDEVYVWGSFLQSRMYAAGVTCGDCHDPHAPSIRGEPDRVCAGCHRPEVFATPAHHGHAGDGPGTRCVNCHMPARTYMVVDDRRDHSFRIPRPALGLAIGAPDPCRTCHSDRSSEWILEAWKARWGSPARLPPHFGVALEAGRRGAPGAVASLARVALDPGTPAIARATAISLLEPIAPTSDLPQLLGALADASDGLIRMAVAGALERLPAPAAEPLGTALLRDPRRAVRAEAARALAPLVSTSGDRAFRDALLAALEEYREAQRIHLDRPSARLNLGNLAARLDDWDAAEREYTAALRLEPRFVPAAVNLAEALRAQDRDGEGQAVLRRALEQNPDQPDLHHALGLALVRSGLRTEALAELERAAELEPEQPRYTYVWAVALYETGHRAKAIRVLRQALAQDPGNAEIRAALRAFTEGAPR